MTFPPPNPSTIALPRERAWVPHLAQTEHYTEIGLAYRLLFYYGNRMRVFGARNDVWYCNEVTNLWQPWDDAFQYFIQNYLIADLHREADFLDMTGAPTEAINVRNAADRLSNRMSAVAGVAARAKLQDVDGDSFLQSIGHRARFDHQSDFFRKEPGDEITCQDGRIRMTPDGPERLRAALPQDGFTKSLAFKVDDVLSGERPEMYLTGLEHFMPDEYAREFFYLRLGTNVLGKAFKSGVLVLLHGTGRNGKTAAIRAPMLVLGEYAKPLLTTDFFITDKRKSVNTDHMTFAYGLDGVRCASHGPEIEKGAMLYEANLKNAIMMQPMDQRKMHASDRIELDLQASLYMCANHLPRVEVADRATKRRFVVIEMGASAEEFGEFRDSKKDFAEIVADNDGPRLAGFQIRKACEYLQHTEMDTKSLHIPQSIRVASEQWLSKLDPIAEFYANYMRPDPVQKVSTAQIYAAYLSFYNTEMAQDGYKMPMSSEDVIGHIDGARFPSTGRDYYTMPDGTKRRLQHYNARILTPTEADAYQPYIEPYEAEFEAMLERLLDERGVDDYESAEYWQIHDQARAAWPQSYFEQSYALQEAYTDAN